ncbi:MAG: hypothetical protein HOE90_06105 [Bacteriovoracaceae bacterium]|jgi:hypothetical protein|nr:hypothetical protein [Bacteriovoracaceae bacterium]
MKKFFILLTFVLILNAQATTSAPSKSILQLTCENLPKIEEIFKVTCPKCTDTERMTSGNLKYRNKGTLSLMGVPIVSGDRSVSICEKNEPVHPDFPEAKDKIKVIIHSETNVHGYTKLKKIVIKPKDVY